MTANKEKSIETLIAGCRRGDRQDWKELIDRLGPVVFSACYRLRLSREECYDVFGKVSLLILENLDNLRESGRVFGYVSKIAFNEALAIVNRRRMIKGKYRRLASESERIDEAISDPARFEHEEELEIMSRAFEKLPRRCRDLLRLLFWETDKVSYKDISRRLKMPVSSIGPNRGRCLEKLRLEMIDEGYEE